MHLRSLTAQTVQLKALEYEVSLVAGETIQTEISRKFHLPTLICKLESLAFHPLGTWTDPQGWFALLLCQRQCSSGDCP
jgi:uncharacterized SAM-dependent methyltransferase